MKCELSIAALQNIDADVLVCPVAVQGGLDNVASGLGKEAEAYLKKQEKAGNMPGKQGQDALFFDVPGIAAKRVLVIATRGDSKSLRDAALKVAQIVKSHCWEKAVSGLHLVADKDVDGVAITAKAFGYTAYTFNHYRTKNKKNDTQTAWTLAVERDAQKSAAQSLILASAWIEGAVLARDLGNMAPNDCYPAYLAKQAEKLAKTYPSLTTEVLKYKEIKALGMGGVLGVAQGSAHQPRFIIMEYKPKKVVNKQPIVLVGKGVTFDSGGISLKPGAGMDEMKFDMCGAAAVFGAMKSLSEAKMPVHVVGLVAAVENMPDGNALKPGDIITSMSGQTIEVLNTDAEGRLILCDALTYAERFNPEAVIDMATLTGACVVALGSHRAGLLGNDEALQQALFEAGERADDPVWRLPLDDEYKKLLESPFADLQNIGGREAGTITAAAFLSAFTEKYAWAHLDIAGVAWLHGKDKGATARPLGLLLEYFNQVATHQ